MASDKGKPAEEWTQRRIQSIEVGFQVIRAMEAANGPLPLRDIAAAAGMPPSKAHLYLVSFVKEGVAFQDPVTGHYGLGRFAIQLGLSAIRQLDVVELAREELATLQRATGFATYLSLWGDRGPGIVSKVDGQRQGSLAVRLGYVLPLLTSATGQVFLTYLDESETAAVRQDEIAAAKRDHSEETASLAPRVTTVKDIQKIVETVRRQGYAMTVNSINSSFAAIAAPVFDYSSRIVATMTVLGSDKQLSGPRKKQTLDALLTATHRLSERLGASSRGVKGKENETPPTAPKSAKAKGAAGR
ncbi:DNA-binding IclR family transcriptional regulator [Rhizobium petrolearium]|uniref:IclR family transcriptional regulator n=1 Tax=Neorhizobium petrolearium TaxID=515361 RepID=UPI001AEA2783|nr:IclR family transcriptional regulator [Neorhizobium petrolearium]MBP1844031.1 DNA-binding IclR family transcriptional regulator [Neorhizobium petrolearium]